MSVRLCLPLVLVAASAQATTLVALDLPTMSKRSDAVVHATVKKVSSRWTGDKMRIVTDIDLEVSESIKGAPTKTVRVVQPGGVVGDIGQRVDGLAAFEPGEEVVVFLEKRGGGSYLLSGMAQGKYKVERSTDGKAVFAVPTELTEVRVIDPVTRQALSSTPQQALKLDALKAMVRAAGPTVDQGPSQRRPIEKSTP